MRCSHTSAGPRVLQFKGFLQLRLPRNGPRWALPLTHLTTLPTGALFSLNANKVVLTTLQHHSGLCILIFPLSYPHTLPEAQKAHHHSPNSQCLSGEDLWTWVEDVWPTAHCGNVMPLRSVVDWERNHHLLRDPQVYQQPSL